ncbi:MAG: type II toxin-antitoxin system VapC family toxin [Bryobacteraceae bacterium]
MKLLLDTHIWLWSQLESHRLSPRVRRALADRKNELWISPITVWEIVSLCQKGRVSLQGGPEAWMRQAMATGSLREAPLTHEIAFASNTVQVPHRDPADRFLAATALVLGLTLVTADEQLAEAKGFSIMMNR